MYNANYMEGVPVKIAEKYKPPPQIYKLSQSLVNKLNLADDYYDSSPQFQYDLQLERKALAKISEWKLIRQRNKNARRERKELRELQREQKQKNLLCSVSYPNADDLSSTESEGEEEEGEKQLTLEKLQCPSTTIATDGNRVTETPNSFHNILQPTVLSNYSSRSTNHQSYDATTSGFSIPNNIQGVNNQSNNSLVKISPVTAFNYKDFEDDTSSPFDNIELKTINDLDVLAQVLHNSQIKTSDKVSDENPQSEVTILENANSELADQSVVTKKITQKIIPKYQNNLPKFSYDLGNLNNAQEAQHKLNNYTLGHVYTNANYSPTLSPQTHLPPYQQQQQQQQQQQLQEGVLNNEYYNNVHVMHMNRNNHLLYESQDAGAKSKSVPDILKELREEIRNSEMRRTRNCSHNLENEKQSSDLFLPETSNNEAFKVEDMFSTLDSESRHIAEQICGMGFPRERVLRAVQLLGADDKKLIEHLIPLSELADLGFDECKISEALIRNENNKNKALDDLIS